MCAIEFVLSQCPRLLGSLEDVLPALRSAGDWSELSHPNRPAWSWTSPLRPGGESRRCSRGPFLHWAALQPLRLPRHEDGVEAEPPQEEAGRSLSAEGW